MFSATLTRIREKGSSDRNITAREFQAVPNSKCAISCSPENKPKQKRMLLHRVKSLFYGTTAFKRTHTLSKSFLRSSITTPSGAILPEPKRTPFSFLGVVSSVVFGLLVGATISKNVANFLEENDLFVPSDDDDDDDDD
ncbi:essential MCU regulator, mitochondrial [Cataglyphis hispanica]|uniref:essential MCU regulator, mitochondrial n=1 Tax=Cataglyphis hispanica TaxID=1086592 RepID=UPI00217FE2C9|nr:essential MCU regulator, mitochondrial [Cataglyphis hispanica]XP_050452477.1 essential MCU regulator, mitochondrial [Cataglyphis hispanica]XP_050452478.1 essential MCU regulator, mitochondrial [Cataglyphis hispanica]